MFKRHGGHADASSTSMMMMASASTTMSSMDSTSTMSMDDMDMDSMHMYFTTQFKDYPVVFKNLSAETEAQAFGIFVLLFFVAFMLRSFEFIKNYLEYKVWKNPAYFNQPQNKYVVPEPRNHSSDESIGKDNSDLEKVIAEPAKASGLSHASEFFRDAIRLVLLIIPEILGYGLMLAVMSYTLTYFFAVAIGSGIGKFVFDKISFKMGIRPSAAIHC